MATWKKLLVVYDIFGVSETSIFLFYEERNSVLRNVVLTFIYLLDEFNESLYDILETNISNDDFCLIIISIHDMVWKT